ncbi:MAG: hypothetical protein B7X86_11075 [Sphingobacteriales bacterium 17-39-43]|uniref:PAS domain S-box protein n=1 Tax=Daejeonella sp. TaxID=2805397 RepID=UPI000BDA9A10|nr:PAS domain S-box protein [Daejeonella sp.]OYZ30981.1 MAG: hypothetical protein B7Y24_11070 [Sphingobacteriales bacterium 16-39-50]OZA23792.1 MAG: hypothetical protein B7X86_11075 [Sphingobacteriales bacterium 17-39-43]HQT22765.1 PAS domain S-box protein [Daejeonella sp.]HQT57760.1 PAS domain S-box protein [Daejeonella sp.]
MEKEAANYNNLFLYSPIPKWVYDINTFEILDVNKAAIKHYGYSRKEFLNMTIRDLRPQPEIPKMFEAHRKSKGRKGNFYIGKFTHLKKNKDKILVEIHGHKVSFKGHESIMVVCIDVTEKDRQWDELKNSEKRLQAASQIAQLGYWRFEMDSGKLIWSDEIYRIWGVQKDKFESSFDYFFSTIHPDDREEFTRKQEFLYSGTENLDFVHRIIMPDKSVKWVHEIGRMERDEAGNMLAVEGTVQDITAQKTEEQRLKLLESVITNTHDAVLITEAEPTEGRGRLIVYVNEAFCKMTGYTSEEVVGKSPEILQGPKSDFNELKRLSKALDKWETCEISTINYKKSGEEFWINFTVSPIANEKGYYTHWIAIERDITEKKNRELEQNLLSRISRIFNEEKGLSDAAQKLCSAIAEFGEFDFVELWIPNLENTFIQLISYKDCSTAATEFYRLTEHVKHFEIGDGMPGLVWKTKKTITWTSKETTTIFIRTQEAKKAGISSLIAAPLLFNDAVVGVLKLGSQKEITQLNKYLKILPRLELFIGSEINRKSLETNLNHLFEAIPDIISLADFQGRFLKMNKAGCELLGYSEEEILFHNFNEFVHPDDTEITVREIQKLKEGKTSLNFENRFITKKGEILWLSWIGVSDIQEGVIYSSAKNVTKERKLSELNRQASSLARIGSWEIDVVNAKLFWSDMLHNIHETDPVSFMPNLENGINFYRKDFQEIVRKSVDSCISEGTSFNYEAAIITAKNKERWIHAIGYSEFVDGKCVRVFGSFQDISQFKETEAKLKYITDDLPGVVFQYMIYPDGTDALHTVSKACEKIWMLTQEECYQDNNLIWKQIKAGGDFDRVLADIQYSVKNMSQWHSRWRNILPDGSIRWHEGYGTPYVLPDKTIVFNSMIFDITVEEKAKVLYDETSKLALVGSWEVSLKNNSVDTLYWSPMVRQILELPADYNPGPTGGFEFYVPESKEQIYLAFENLINRKIPFDLELMIKTAKDNLVWIRCIGKGEFIGDECVRIFGSYQNINQRKVAELEFKKLFQEKTNIIESIADAFFTLDRNFIVTYWNRAAEDLIGVKRENLVGNCLWEVFPEAVNLPSYRNYYKVLETGQPLSFEDFYGIWLEVNAYPSEEGLTVFFRDISFRKEAEEQLKLAYEERNQILESIGDAFFAVDREWKVTYWNRMAEEVLMKPKEEILGKYLWAEYGDAIDTDFYRMYHKAAETGQSIAFEEYYATHGKWFEVTVYPSANGLSVYFKDITFRKEIDSRILEANERFEKVAEATNEAIWDWNIVDNTIFRGKGFSTLFGLDSTGTNLDLEAWSDHIISEDRDRVLSTINSAINDPDIRIWEEEYRYEMGDGNQAYVLDRGIVIRDKWGKPIRMVGAMQDISYRKEHEQHLRTLNAALSKNIAELEIANEELEQFAFITSHDLQEPLRMITSFLNQLERKYSDKLDDKARQYIGFATDGAVRMKQIILDLLEFSRAGKLNENKKQVNLEELMNQYKLLRSRLIHEKSVKLTHDKLPVISAFSVPLTQTIHCLLDNAIKYSKESEKPIICMSVLDERKHWIFSVKDNGIGIEAEYFEKIFVIFQRLHNRSEYSGTGMGLAIVKKNVESWGGKVWLESEKEVGSTFYFTVPK